MVRVGERVGGETGWIWYVSCIVKTRRTNDCVGARGVGQGE